MGKSRKRDRTNKPLREKYNTHISVAIYPGQIAFTCTLCCAHSLLNAFVNWLIPPLAAAYAGTVIPPWKVSNDPKLMILPRLSGTMCRPAARERTNADVRFVVRTYQSR